MCRLHTHIESYNLLEAVVHIQCAVVRHSEFVPWQRHTLVIVQSIDMIHLGQSRLHEHTYLDVEMFVHQAIVPRHTFTKAVIFQLDLISYIPLGPVPPHI